MFFGNRDSKGDNIPMWTWFFIFPGLVLVTVLLVRRLRYQAHISKTMPREFRIELNLRNSHLNSEPQQADESRIAIETEAGHEFAWPANHAATGEAGQPSADEVEIGNASLPEETQVADAAAQANDDLKIIEGIGPKIESILKNAGIMTFRQLAGTSVENLYQILREANLRLADPGTWPEQARLAANENWDFLKALQGRTRAGRRSIED